MKLRERSENSSTEIDEENPTMAGEGDEQCSSNVVHKFASHCRLVVLIVRIQALILTIYVSIFFLFLFKKKFPYYYYNNKKKKLHVIGSWHFCS